MKLEINDEEKILLVEMLEKALAEIPIEIHHSRINEFKVYLKEQQGVIEQLLKKFA
jgi:hypothetical protein